MSGGVLGSKSQQQTEHPGADLPILSDISVIFYNLIRLVTDQGNEYDLQNGTLGYGKGL